MILYFIIFLLVVGTILEMVLHYRQLQFVTFQRDEAELDAKYYEDLSNMADDLIQEFLRNQVELLSQRDAARAVADAAERQTVLWSARCRGHIRTIENLEQSVELLSDELDSYMLQHAKRVLGGQIVATVSHHDGERFTSLSSDEL